MHAEMGTAYNLPDIRRPGWTVRVVENAQGRPIMAAGIRATAEAYLWLDKEWGDAPHRWMSFAMLHEGVREAAREQGLEDVWACIPHAIEEKFGKRLTALGWARERADWALWSTRV